MAIENFPTQLYSVIYLDPSWPSGKRPGAGVTSTATLYGREARRATLTKKECLELPVASIANPRQCYLVMWTTWMHLHLAFRCIEQWGFTYRTGCPWLKVCKDGVTPIFNMGVWFRGCTEILLVATKGRAPNPRPAREGLWKHPRGEHSRKPQETREWIEECIMPLCWPLGDYPVGVELFARQAFPLWDRWGDQAPVEKEVGEAGIEEVEGVEVGVEGAEDYEELPCLPEAIIDSRSARSDPTDE